MGIFATRIQGDGYVYTQTIDQITPEVIEEAKKGFTYLQNKGVIDAESFWAETWILRDEATPPVKLHFTINDFHYRRICEDLLGCTADEYKTAMRVAISGYFGASTCYLYAYCRALRILADTLTEDCEFEVDAGNTNSIERFLTILPCKDENTRNELIRHVQRTAKAYAKAQREKVDTARKLCYYQSYLRFDKVLTEYWRKATPLEKILFFPVYFWWSLSTILPLRPSEVVFTPRDCLVWIDGAPHLRVRRTERKGKSLGCKYTIPEDFCCEVYPITVELATEIEIYIAATQDAYSSPIDTLFCLNTQSALKGTHVDPDTKYLRNHLDRLLVYFYDTVVTAPPYNYVVRNKDNMPLGDMEIEKISLGDTRHIAMISLMMSGKSELICQDLGGHSSVDTSQNYFGNVRTFVDAVVWEQVRTPKVHDVHDHSLPAKHTRVHGGICVSDKTAVGDFSDCECAVSEYGEFGHCRSCVYFRPIAGQKTNIEPQDDKMKTAFLRVLDAAWKAKNGLSTKDEIVAASMQLQSEVKQYITRATLAQRL